MHRSTSSFASPSSTNMIGSEMERSVTVTLTREEQEMVNLTRRQGTSYIIPYTRRIIFGLYLYLKYLVVLFSSSVSQFSWTYFIVQRTSFHRDTYCPGRGGRAEYSSSRVESPYRSLTTDAQPIP